MLTILQSRIFFRVALLSTVLSLLVPIVSLAQEPVETVIQDERRLAQINLSNAALISQDNDSLSVSFVLENLGSSPQSDLRYQVQLVVEDVDGMQPVADFIVSEEVISLLPEATISRVVNYPLAGIAPGKYTVWITAGTSGGMILGLGKAGEITIESASVLGISARNCQLTVGDDQKKYDIYQGVDISISEDIWVECLVKNHSVGTIKAFPEYKTFRRNVYGPEVSTPVSDVVTFDFSGGEEKMIIFNLPKAINPQAYDVTFRLINTENNLPISNRLATHYVLKGESATIQNLNFDKPYYLNGEQINLDVVWTGPADNFYDSRDGHGTIIEGGLIAQVSIFDGTGVPCVTPTEVVLEEGRDTVSFISQRDCIKPVAKLNLVTKTGILLDSREISVVEAPEYIEKLSSETDGSATNSLMFVTVIALSIAVLTTFIVSIRSNKSNLSEAGKMLFVGALASTAFFGFQVESVEAVSWNHRWSNSEGWHNHNVTVNVNKTVFLPGEQINLSSLIYNADCANNSIPIHRLTATLLGETIILSENPTVNTVGNKYGGGTFIAPTTPGVYDISLRMTTLNRNEHSYNSITITVSPPIPEKPTSVTATCGDGGSTNIVWSAVSGSTYYALRVDYTGSPAPHLVQKDNYTKTSYIFAATPGIAYSTWVHACNSSGCSAAASSDFTCDMPLPPATATIYSTTCEIQIGSSSCIAALTWDITNAVDPNVYNSQTNTVVASVPSGTNVPATLYFGVNTVNARDKISTIASTNVLATCVTGSSWNGSSCEADAVPPPPEPTISIGLSRELIRSGETVDVTVDVTAAYSAQCTLYGVETTPITFTHTGTPVTSSDTFTTRPLRSAQVVTLTCVPDAATGADSNTATSRVDVIPVVQEI
jgi:hypothetical protein